MDNQSPAGDCEEEHEEESEGEHIILSNGGCANQIEYTGGSLNYEGIPIDGCSQLYVGDIDIRFESVNARQSYHEHEYEYLVVVNEEPISIFLSPLELQEVDQIKKKEEEKVCSHEPSFIEVFLKMSEMNIHEDLILLNGTKALVSNSCYNISSLEYPYFLEYMEKIQR